MSESTSKLQVHSHIDTMRRGIERARSEPEQPVIHAQPDWPREGHLYAAARIDAEADVGVRRELLGVEPTARDEVRLDAEDGKRRLQHEIAGPRLERRRVGRR